MKIITAALRIKRKAAKRSQTKYETDNHNNSSNIYTHTHTHTHTHTVKNEILDLFNFITLINELIKCDNGKLNAIKCVSINHPLFLTYVWQINSDNGQETTVQSTVATKTCSSLISCSTIHELSGLHAWKCDAMSRNVVKRLASQNRVNCLFDMMANQICWAFTEQRKICA